MPARLQILELPSEVVGEVVRTPFVIVIDQVDDDGLIVHLRDNGERMKTDTGASAVLVFEARVDVA